MGNLVDLQYIDITDSIKNLIIGNSSWGNAGEHIYLGPNCLSIGALAGTELVGFISAYRRSLAPPVANLSEAFINIIVVLPHYHRRGIGEQLVRRVINWAASEGLYQVCAWSDDVKIEALGLWQKTGFGLCRVEREAGGQRRCGFYIVRPVRHEQKYPYRCEINAK